MRFLLPCKRLSPERQNNLQEPAFPGGKVVEPAEVVFRRPRKGGLLTPVVAERE